MSTVRQLVYLGEANLFISPKANIGISLQTAVIGGKTWMAENMNYQTSSGSKKR